MTSAAGRASISAGRTIGPAHPDQPDRLDARDTQHPARHGQTQLGHIVNISSINAVRIIPDMAAYSTSKAGVHMFTETLRGELAETAIRVTEMQPGLTRTGNHPHPLRGDRKKEKDYFGQFKMAPIRRISHDRSYCAGPATHVSDCGDDDSTRKPLLKQCR